MFLVQQFSAEAFYTCIDQHFSLLRGFLIPVSAVGAVTQGGQVMGLIRRLLSLLRMNSYTCLFEGVCSL